MSKELHVILGTGPVGCHTAVALVKMGLDVVAVNRSGRRPPLLPDEVELRKADVSSPEQAIEACKGADVVYQALNPPYHRWAEEFPPLQSNAMAAAMEHGAKYVSIDNLYMYDSSSPIREDSPLEPRSRKGEVRARMAQEVMDAHERGRLRCGILRSSDYYGPGVVNSALGERVFGALISGRKAQILGAPDIPHSWAYIQDVGQAAAILGTQEEALGKVWFTPHAPPETQARMIEMAARYAGASPSFVVVAPWMMRIVGLFVPQAGAALEMLYQFNEPFVVDSSSMTDAFGLAATPLEQGLRMTMEWYGTMRA